MSLLFYDITLCLDWSKYVTMEVSDVIMSFSKCGHCILQMNSVVFEKCWKVHFLDSLTLSFERRGLSRGIEEKQVCEGIERCEDCSWKIRMVYLC